MFSQRWLYANEVPTRYVAGSSIPRCLRAVGDGRWNLRAARGFSDVPAREEATEEERRIRRRVNFATCGSCTRMA